MSYAQNTPLEIVIDGLSEYCIGIRVLIVADVKVTDTDPRDKTLNVVIIQISGGFTLNQDVMVLNGIHPNIIATWRAD